MHDILYASEGFIHHGDGCSYVTVHFRLVIFRPFVGEVMVGKIRSCSQEGVRGKKLLPPYFSQDSLFKKGYFVQVEQFE